MRIHSNPVTLAGALLCLAAAALPGVGLAAGPAHPAGGGPVIVPLDREPKDIARPTADQVAAAQREVAEHPDDRGKRLELVHDLLAVRDLNGAVEQAKAWRARDAYNLVAVRALGDALMERGDQAAAERVYSAIVELLPRDPDAQRALATLLKQQGDLAGARQRLESAVAQRPDDARLLFELADVELRDGKADDATRRFEGVIAASSTAEQVRFPAKQRLGQILGERLRNAKQANDTKTADELAHRISGLDLRGGLENDVHVYLTWDTDRTDVDLWVTTPAGEKVFYGHKTGAGGESLYDDVTTGYGPESFTAHHAQPGEYLVQVNYYSARRTAFPEARGEVVVVVDEGRPTEQKSVLPYRLYAEKQTVNVAKVRFAGKAGGA